MSKIVKAYALMNVQKSLLQNINSGPQIEEAWKDVVNKIGNNVGSAFGFKRKDTPTESPAANIRNSSEEVSKALATVVAQIISPTINFDKYKLYLSPTDLTNHFLKTGSRRAMAEYLVNGGLLEKNLKFVAADDALFEKFVKEAPANTGRMVLLDVPAQLTAALKASGADVISVVEKMLSLKYYVLTFNLYELKKISASLDSSSEIEDKAKLFNPAVLENYPDRGIKNKMVEEWSTMQKPPEDELDKRDADVSNAERKAGLQDREDVLQKKEINRSVSGAHASEVLRIITDATGEQDAIKKLQGYISKNKDTLTDQRLIGIMNDLNRKFKSEAITAIIKHFEAGGMAGGKDQDRDRIMGPTSEGFKFQF